MNNYHRRPTWNISRGHRGLWLAAVIALVGLFFWGLSTAPSLTTATAASKPRGTDSLFSKPSATLTDDQLKVFAHTLDIVEEQYAEPKTSKDLVYGAIQGAADSLDPHSSFMTPDEFKELQVETEGKFSGIGIEITLKDRKLIVVSPIEGTPAYRAGILAGDQIVKIDGTPTKNISITDA
jgi:C-terminal processing protease CtpA/Prc